MAQGKAIPDSFWWDEFLPALQENLGHARMTCQKLSISHTSYYSKRFSDEKFAEACDKRIHRISVTMIEEMAYTKAMSGDSGMIKFMLKNIGGARWHRDVMEKEISKAGVSDEIEEREWERVRSYQKEHPEENIHFVSDEVKMLREMKKEANGEEKPAF